MRLLIIEDDRDAADYLVKAFREVGHVADQAGDGEDGLQLALDGEYDVLIVDRMLPKRDGLVTHRGGATALDEEGKDSAVSFIARRKKIGAASKRAETRKAVSRPN